MTGKWPEVALGELLKKAETWISLAPDTIYKEVTVRLWGRGVALRREVAGIEIGADRRLRVEAGQFILSRIDARNGALGLIPQELDGAVVSNDFPAFDTDKDKLIPEYLGWLSKTSTFVDLCRAASEGTTNRVRLKEDLFLRLSFNIPPLSEQRRIVAKIEGLAARMDEARALRHASKTQLGLLLEHAAAEQFARQSVDVGETSFAKLNPHITSGPRNWGQFVSEDSSLEFRFYRAQDVGTDGRTLGHNQQFIRPPAGKQGRTAQVQPGDLMIVITGATVGRVALFTPDDKPGFVSQHVAICRLPQTRIVPKYALWGLRAKDGQDQLRDQKYGQGKPGLNLGNITNLTLPIPSLANQHQIVRFLDELESRAKALGELAAPATDELTALLPAILDQAFKGAL